jgi:Glycosyl transferase family 21
MSAPAMGMAAEYILPLRWTDDAGLPDLAAYLRRLTDWIPVTVVDGSAPELFEHHRRMFPPAVRHLPPEAGPGGKGGKGGNGKVAGVMTGVRASMADLLVIADDDVRYTRESLAAVVHHLRSADVVRPQNYFEPLPWHAQWDTARILINRAWSADFPGTLALRRNALLATDGYAPVLFENLELIRTITAAGGREKVIPDLFVARRPPTARHFLKQRIRQAYDDFAQPRRLAAELALLPAVVAAAYLPAPHRWTVFLGLASAAVVAAETGRRRHNGTPAFPLRAVWFAPLWALERAVCIWIALVYRLAGGVPYAGTRLKTAAHSENELRRRHHGKIAAIRPQGAQSFTTNPQQEQK